MESDPTSRKDGEKWGTQTLHMKIKGRGQECPRHTSNSRFPSTRFACSGQALHSPSLSLRQRSE